MSNVLTGPSSLLAKIIGYNGKSLLYENRMPADASESFKDLDETAFKGGLFEVFIPPMDKPRLKQTSKGFEADYPVMQNLDYALRANLRECASLLKNNFIVQEKINWIRRPEQLNTLMSDSRTVLILHLADADAIDENLEFLDIFYALGVRSLGITWSRQNRFGYGTPYKFPGHPNSGPGLSDLGVHLVRKCNALGIVIDSAHLNEAGFRGVAENSTKPLVISHGTPHALNASSRAFTDAMLKMVAATDGIVGISLEGVKESSAGYANDMVRHIEYVMDKVGDRHVGFGSDMVLPSDPTGKIRTLLPEVINLLASKGYRQTTIDGVAYGNWQRILMNTL